jgi:CheY-like chemotaxis protein
MGANVFEVTLERAVCCSRLGLFPACTLRLLTLLGPPEPDMSTILSVCNDASLLSTRQSLLERDGYNVTSAFGSAGAIRACDRDFDLIILCHNIPRTDKRTIVKKLLDVMRQCSGCFATVSRSPKSRGQLFPIPKLLLETVKGMLARAVGSGE